MSYNTPAPVILTKPFLKAVDTFLKTNGITQTRAQAKILGVGDSTLRAWKAGSNRPTAEMIAKVSSDMAAIDRFLAVCSCDR